MTDPAARRLIEFIEARLEARTLVINGVRYEVVPAMPEEKRND